MLQYFIIRLGADSEKEIRRIDAVDSYSSPGFAIAVSCRQVPKGVTKNDVAIIWLGTNNNKGGKTPWVQGIRAIGRIEEVLGSGEYGASKTLHVSIGVILPKSVTKMDIVRKQSLKYPDIAAMPVLGVNNYSSQVVQRIDPSEPGQNINALFEALDTILPGMSEKLSSIYPSLTSMLNNNYAIKYSVSPLDGDANDREESNKHTYNSLVYPSSEQDSDGLEPDEDRSSEIDVPFDPTKIDIIVKQMTISALEDRLDNDELDLTPDFQRQANIWDVKRKSRLIESILLRIPLPSFYFSEDMTGSYSVVDGLQRLCAVFHFKNPILLSSATGTDLAPLRLKGLQYLKELENKVFGDLDRKFQRRISELEITTNIIRANTPSAVKFNVFARLNQGGLPLNAQEIRNAIFPGEWRNQLRHLAESKAFLDATDRKVVTSRQQDMELVLRFIAIWQLGSPYRRPSGQTLDEFLNHTVEHIICKWNSEKWKQVEEDFKYAINITCSIRGKHAFRKSVGSMPRKPINRSLFEAELIVFGSIDRSRESIAVNRINHIEKEFMYALETDDALIQSLSYGTGSAESSNTRISTLRRILEGILDA